MSDSKSSNTLDSYSSLIDGYDDDTENDNDILNDLTENKTEVSTETSQTLFVLPDFNNSFTVSPSTKTNHYNSISQIGELDSIFSKSQPTTPTTVSYNYYDEINSSSPIAPTTPLFEYNLSYDEILHTPCDFSEKDLSLRNNSAGFLNNFDSIKIKVILGNQEDDIIALKIKRSNLISIIYLKKLLSFKIYKDYNLSNHYKLQPKDSKKGFNDEDLLYYIKSQNKVSLKLVRLRE